MVVKNPSDFTGDHLGASEASTRQILAATAGKVLVIDEVRRLVTSKHFQLRLCGKAYMLYGGKQTTDSYKTSVIDTIVAEVQSTLGEDRAVLLLGYEENMRDMFQVSFLHTFDFLC